MLGTLVLVVVMLVGGQLVLNHDNELPPSLFITYIIIFSQIIPPARALTTAFYNIQRGIASGDRIYRILDAEETIRNKENPVTLHQFEHSIEYKNVSFAYHQHQVLNEINLTIPIGTTVALVGQSGAGKSTMADLLPRFYDVTSGCIEIDGMDIRKLKLSDLNALMGIVTQEAILFNDSVFNNIAFGRPDTREEEIIAAAKIANAHEFIVKLEQGYHTNIGDRGAKLSGGQRQRLSIARAVLKNPPILILDEATSALDTESERLVQDALQNLTKNRTSIVIAHRLSTIQHADKIIVLHQGKIIEQGNHIELISANGAYKNLIDMQTFQ
jgi:subfamily B ATP-binding cassette protein MsbA